MANISDGNARRRGLLPSSRAFSFEMEAILMSFGFDQNGPFLRRLGLKYRHITAPRLLELSHSASNLDAVKYGFRP
jgi:hypothetical protein